MPPKAPLPSSSAIEALCLSCGLCCNGVLFGDVELQRGDDARRLAAQGLVLGRKGRKTCFQQPCACFREGRCRIYIDRPVRCRAFECRLLQRAQSGEVSPAQARKKIRQARQAADTVLQLVRQLGQPDEDLPLNQRYALVMAEPIDLAGDNQVIRLRGKLMRAVHRLVQILEQDFL